MNHDDDYSQTELGEFGPWHFHTFTFTLSLSQFHSLTFTLLPFSDGAGRVWTVAAGKHSSALASSSRRRRQRYGSHPPNLFVLFVVSLLRGALK